MNENTRKLMFSSATDDWETPPWLLERIQKEIGPIGLDAAASHDNAVCDKYFTQADNGLVHNWGLSVPEGHIAFVNPPYGARATPEWVRKARASAFDIPMGVVALIPARTETRWFHESCIFGDLYFLKGRVAFYHGGQRGASAPFPSVLVHFRKSVRGRKGEVHFVDWRET